MKFRSFQSAAIGIVCGAILLLNGCSSSGPNVITVTISPSAIVVIAGQVQSFTATVGGSTTTTVSIWTCSYSYTPLPTTAAPSPKAVTGTCTSGSSLNGGNVGSWVITNTNGSNVLTYTAPPLSAFPNPAPTLTFTAEADANKSKTGTATVGLDSGIRVSVTPSTVTVPVGITPAQKISLSASFLNSPATGQQWKVVQPNSSSTTVADQTANPLSDSCDPDCGTIDNNGIYTAPSTLPTNTKPSGSVSTPATTVYAVVWSSADTNHFAFAVATLVNATTNPITFNSIYPTTIPAGGVNQDIFLNAHNFLNTTNIYFQPSGSAQPSLIPNTNIFTIPISLQYCTPSATGVTPVVTCDASLMTRIRLTPDLITKAGTGQVIVTGIPCNPSSSSSCTATTSSSCTETVNTSGSTATISCPVELVYTSPALVAAVPDSFPQGTNTTLSVDGGYFGNTNSSIVKLLLYGTTDLVNQGTSGSRTLVSTTSGSQIPTPGLFEVSVQSDAPNSSVPLFPIATTNIAVQPTFLDVNGIYHPAVVPPQPYPPNKPLPPNSLPSSIALDSSKGFAVITEQGTNTAQFIDLTSGTPQPSGLFSTGNAPTSIAIDNQINLAGYPGQDLGIVVNSLDNNLTLYALNAPSGATKVGTVPVDLATLIDQPGVTGLPTPFSFGVDPGTHLGVVTYQNTNIAFIVDVNPNLNGADTRPCFVSTQKVPCVIAPVSLNTGGTPQVVMQPNAPLAYVTPGGSGSTSVVDLLRQGTSAKIAPAVANGTSGAVRTGTIVKIITQTPHGINPALGGTVIISGLTPTDLNGTFQVIPGSVTDPYTFSYAQPGTADETETNTSPMLGQVQYGTPYFSFNTGAFATGAAINPVTRTFAWADYNSSSQQIGFIGTLDQTVTTLTLTAGSCQGCTPTPAGAPEIGFRSVAFDPFTNVLIAYDPSVNSGANFSDNAISLISPGGPGDATNLQPFRIIQAIGTGQIGTGSYTPTGQSVPITVNGPMTYDPKTKNVLVGNAGSNTLTYLNLDPNNMFKPVAIQKITALNTGISNIQPALGANITSTGYQAPKCDPNNPTLTCMAQAVPLNTPATVKIFGQGFGAVSGTVARLDTTPSVSGCSGTTTFCTQYVSDSEVDVTIPASMLTVAHDYALDVVLPSGVVSNSIDLYAVGILDLTSVCLPTTAFPQGPEGVAIDEPRKVAFVTNYACNSVTSIAIDPAGYKKTDGSIAPYGSILNTVTVGPNPIGIATISRLGFTVVANSSDTPTGTASIINTSNPESMSVLSFTTTSGSTTTTTNKVPVGISPLGVAMDDDHAYALIANNGSNTVTSIDLTVLLSGAVTDTSPTPTTIAVSGAPTAIAVDPNRGIAVVTLLQNSGTTAAIAGLDVINLTTQPPARSTSASVSSLTASLTGLVFDQAQATSTSTTSTTSAALFYGTSTQQNAIYAFNPDSGSTQTIRVGINPFGIGYNYNTGAIVTVNSTSNTTSVIDSQSFKTRETQSISSFSQFPIAIDRLNSIALIADQNNNRIVFLPVPK
jgi:DNA-binding beta-propeller fold protein YncE